MRPTVCCVILVNGRAEMVARAIASFRAQTYERKRLLVLESHKTAFSFTPYGEPDATSVHMPEMSRNTIGALRNAANWCTMDHFDVDADIIAHFDSDDWSHPRRLEEQVALLEVSGKQCVGYNELLFWDTRESHPAAWIYRNHQANWAAGASLMYRRELWERQPFDDAPHEDTRWLRTPLVSGECWSVKSTRFGADTVEPRMVCGIHNGNTEGYGRAVMMRNPDVWRRAPEFDEYCEGVMRCA